MNKKIVSVFFLTACLLAMMLPQLGAQLKQVASQDDYKRMTASQDDYQYLNNTLHVSGPNYVLEPPLFWGHYLVFVDVEKMAFVIDSDNTVFDLNGRTLLWEREKPPTATPGCTAIAVSGRRNVTIKNGNIIAQSLDQSRRFQEGIWVDNSSFVNIVSNNVSGCTLCNIEVMNSNNVNVISNIVAGSGDIGLYVHSNSSAVSILHNNVSSNDAEGIYLRDSAVDVSGNTISYNEYYGIHVFECRNQTIRGNTISNNDPSGIYMDRVMNSTFVENMIFNNTEGLNVEGSAGNIVYHNDFISIERNVETSGSTNMWDAGYGREEDPGFGGNYWHDYQGADQCFGTKQNVPGSDGIGDVPYDVASGIQDRYPLKYPWGSMLRVFDVPWKQFDGVGTWVNMTCSVAVFTNSSVTSFNFTKDLKQISLDLSKPTSSNASFCNILISERLLEGDFKVSVDDTPAAAISNWDETYWDETYYMIQVVTSSNNSRIKIIGQTATRIVGDVNGDGVVDIVDISIAAINFGKKTDP